MTSTTTISTRLAFLQRALGQIIVSKSGREASARCPFLSCPSRRDSKKFKLAIRVSDFFNHCWVCNWRSRTLLPIIRKFYKHLEREYVSTFSSPLAEDTVTQNNSIEFPSDTIPLIQLPSSHRGVQYVMKRGCTERDMWRWRMMWIDSGENRNRVLMPSFDLKGELNFFWVQ